MKEAVIKFKKDYYLTFVLILVLIPLVLLSVVKIIGSKTTSPNQPEQPSPQPTRTNPLVAPKDIGAPTPPPYLRLMKSVQDRKSLSPADEEAKRRILSPLSGKSGVLYETDRVSIEYLSAPDIFQAEILSADTSEAKSEAAAWFSSQGITSDGMCRLPVQFFLNKSVSGHLGTESASFSPLPEGC